MAYTSALFETLRRAYEEKITSGVLDANVLSVGSIQIDSNGNMTIGKKKRKTKQELNNL